MSDEAPDLIGAMSVPDGFPVPAPRGDEDLCASCASHPGEELDAEGRLLCTHCLAEQEAKG